MKEPFHFCPECGCNLGRTFSFLQCPMCGTEVINPLFTLEDLDLEEEEL